MPQSFCKGEIKHTPPTSEIDGSNPGPYVGKSVVALPMVSSLQYRTLTH